MSALDACILAIPSNPDISGIGVRAAIYIQNFISFVPAIWALWDGEISTYELESIETQSTTILITAFAILISAMVQAQTRLLSNFHASLVLSLSWMNNTNAFIYFLLYVQYKSQPGPGQIKMDLGTWMKHIHEKLSVLVSFTPVKREPMRTNINNGTDDGKGQQRSGHQTRKPSSIKDIFRRIVLVLGSLHLSIMAALGIWLWTSPRSFGDENSSCVIDFASTVILGHHVPLRSHELRAWSIAIYSLFLLPGLNLVLPMGLFLWLFLAHQAWRQRRSSDQATPPATTMTPSQSKSGFPRFTVTWRERYTGSSTSPSLLPVIVGIVILFVINVIFLVDIELTLHQSGASTDESKWTFGQTLALLLLVLPLRDLTETMVARREKERQRREQEHQDELARKEQERRDKFTEYLQNAIEKKADMKTICGLVERGADVNTVFPDGINVVLLSTRGWC
ncbi:hypothetical protein C8J57DRAFT_277336 [Mycena rebaudengoi]|nr:hypothetical protein C8J57DRAFT_277336 [Mycena rebaudengoi]